MQKMSGPAYYNEIDPRAAAWLRELISAGEIAPGVVDERDLRDVTPAELKQYTQCHFFAGIGVWSYALRRAGWPDDKPVWTGSCPCQPFSSAGKGAGFADERHIWPYWHHLIRTVRPGIVFGEQVASADGLAWLDLVQADLEGENYTSRAIDCCAAGFGAPHIRQRLWFVANSNQQRRGEARQSISSVRTCRGRASGTLANTHSEPQQRSEKQSTLTHSGQRDQAELANRSRRRCSARVLADLDRTRLEGFIGNGNKDAERQDQARHIATSGDARILGDNPSERRTELRDAPQPESSGHVDSANTADRPGPTNGFWRDADWLFCRDGRWRPVETGTSPLAHGLTGRVGLLRGYGNAINAEVATAVIRAAAIDLR